MEGERWLYVCRYEPCSVGKSIGESAKIGNTRPTPVHYPLWCEKIGRGTLSGGSRRVMLMSITVTTMEPLTPLSFGVTMRWFIDAVSVSALVGQVDTVRGSRTLSNTPTLRDANSPIAGYAASLAETATASPGKNHLR